MDALTFPDLPSSPVLGDNFYDSASDKTYRYLAVQGGAKGGVWGYANDPTRPEIIVDLLFDDNPRLAGRLLEPWVGQKEVWVLAKGWVTPPRVPRIYIDALADGRYERNQVDDVRYVVKEEVENSDEEG